MADRLQATRQRRRMVSAGHVLVWIVAATSSETAVQIAASMGVRADALRLGSWGYAERGLGGGDAIFDLTLARSVDEVMIKLIFDRLPDGVY